MENQAKVTLEQLAERFGKSVWVKGDLKRIYLNDEGYNTKKMSTKTFIWQNELGEFKVSCRIECSSQPYQWINSQEEKIKEGLYTDIENYVARILDPSIDAKEAEEEAIETAKWEAGREERERKASEAAIEKEEQKKLMLANISTMFESGGKKYSHAKFGVGVVACEDETSITLVFENVGEKKLLKGFAKLEKVA